MQLALGDALAMALLEAKGFTARDFRDLHPGGKLGAKLAFVRDIMHRGEAIPRIEVGAPMAQAIVEMTSKGFGCVGVFEANGALAGLITDGDLRRHLRKNLGLDTPVEMVMTRRPRVIGPDALVAEALEVISHKISNLLVVEQGAVVGIVHFHDLLGSARRDNLALPGGLWQKPTRKSCRSSVVEHSLGKGEVESSILSGSTTNSSAELKN